MMKWKQVSTYSSNSGFLVFKEFSFHAFTIFNVKKEIDYLCMYLHDAQKNFQNDKKMDGWMDGWMVHCKPLGYGEIWKRCTVPPGVSYDNMWLVFCHDRQTNTDNSCYVEAIIMSPFILLIKYVRIQSILKIKKN